MGASPSDARAEGCRLGKICRSYEAWPMPATRPRPTSSSSSFPSRAYRQGPQGMIDERNTDEPSGGAATENAPPARPGLLRNLAHRLAGDAAALPVEGRLASFDGATGWLNSEPLTPEGLRGRVVLVDFWTYTCVNWLRTAPVRPGLGREVRGRRPDGRRRPYAGVRLRARPRQHRRAVARLRRGVPDRDRQRLRRSGAPSPITSGRRSTSRMSRAGSASTTSARASTRRPRWSIQQLLLDAGADDIDQDLVRSSPGAWRWPPTGGRCSRPRPTSGTARAPASRRTRSRRSTSPTSMPRPRGSPSTTGRSRGTGRWPGTPRCRTSPADGSPSSSTRATSTSSWDRHPRGASIPFRVLLDGQAADGATGPTWSADGSGIVNEQRTYQLIRQPGPIADRRFEIEFLDAGVEAYCFTFG